MVSGDVSSRADVKSAMRAPIKYCTWPRSWLGGNRIRICMSRSTTTALSMSSTLPTNWG